MKNYLGVCVVNGTVSVVPRPVAQLSPSCVRLTPKYAGICGSDLHALRSPQFASEVIRGHEVTAVVREVGSAVHRLQVGDKVVVEPLKWCGSCPQCRKQRYNLCEKLNIVGVMSNGGISEDLVVPESSLFLLPPEVSLAVGVLTEPLAVMIHALRAAAYTGNGEVAILGAGCMGLLGMVAAHYFGAKSVIISYRYKFQGDLAAKIGTELGLEVKTVESCSVVDYFTENGKPDLVLETVGGSSSTAKEGVDIICPGGKVVILGLFEPHAPKPDLFTMMCKEAMLIGSNCYDHAHSTSDFAVALSILSRHGRFLYDYLVSHEFPLKNAQEAFNTANGKEDTKSVKVVFCLE